MICCADMKKTSSGEEKKKWAVKMCLKAVIMQNTYRWGWETGSAHRLRAAAAAAADDGAAVSGGRAGGRGHIGSQRGGRGGMQRILGFGQAAVGHGKMLLAVQRHHHHICGRPSLGKFLLIS